MFFYTSPWTAKYLEMKLVKMINDYVEIIEGTVEAVFEHPIVKIENRSVLVLESHLPAV